MAASSSDAAPAPYDRARFNRALIANALLDPFNVVLLAGVLIVGIVLGIFAYALPIGAVLYVAGAVRTYFDEDVANKVLAREKAAHRKQVEAGRAKVKPEDFAPPIARLLHEARKRELRIGDAIERAELPFEEVSAEIDRFVAAMDSTAARAQLLYEALSDTPPPRVEARLAEVRAARWRAGARGGADHTAADAAGGWRSSSTASSGRWSGSWSSSTPSARSSCRCRRRPRRRRRPSWRPTSRAARAGGRDRGRDGGGLRDVRPEDMTASCRGRRSRSGSRGCPPRARTAAQAVPRGAGAVLEPRVGGAVVGENGAAIWPAAAADRPPVLGRQGVAWARAEVIAELEDVRWVRAAPSPFGRVRARAATREPRGQLGLLQMPGVPPADRLPTPRIRKLDTSTIARDLRVDRGAGRGWLRAAYEARG